MRTTLSIDDELLQRARRTAERSRLSLRETINRALRLGLDKLDPRPARRSYTSTTFSMGFPPQHDLVKALQLASLLDDDEVVRKLQLGK